MKGNPVSFYSPHFPVEKCGTAAAREEIGGNFSSAH